MIQRGTAMPVVEPTPGEVFQHGVAYLAPRDHHLVFVAGGSFDVTRGPPLHFSRPAADALFGSAARIFGPRVVGVVLSGSGFDGASGCIAIKAAGGAVLIQAPTEASFPFMPQHTLINDHVDAVLPIDEIPGALAQLAAGRMIENR